MSVREKDATTDGRDTGIYASLDVDAKTHSIVSAETRVKRRHKESAEKGA